LKQNSFEFQKKELDTPHPYKESRQGKGKWVEQEKATKIAKCGIRFKLLGEKIGWVGRARNILNGDLTVETSLTNCILMDVHVIPL
jgi:hypothetical protein